MCLLLHKPEGIDIPQALIRQAGADNPHGWGVMTADGSRIRAWRGMRADAISKALRAVGSAESVVHWRMATHGTTNLANCHPFEFKADGMGFGLAHNGIISAKLAPITDPRRSDTWHFTHAVVAPSLRTTPALHGTEEWVAALGDAVGAHNRLAILRADGALDIVNRKQGTEWEGLWLSNEYSIPDRSGRWGGLMEWDDASETWHDADTRKWSGDDECDDLVALAGLDTDGIAEWCERDPYWVASMIRAHFRSDRRWR